jgi:hypothetical protein
MSRLLLFFFLILVVFIKPEFKKSKLGDPNLMEASLKGSGAQHFSQSGQNFG